MPRSAAFAQSEYFLDDLQISISGNLAPAGNNFVVDGMWGLADSTAWVWNNLQPGHPFLIAGTFANSKQPSGGSTSEDTSLNPAMVELNLGNGTYSNVSFLALSHGFHLTSPPTATVGVTAEGTSLGQVSENFSTSFDFQSGGQRYNWVTLADPIVVTDGSLSLDFGRAFSSNEAWYSIGRIQADFTPGTAGLAGDFNGDSAVDGADFLIWQQGQGLVGSATIEQGDANNDAAVDAADLELWKTNFGMTSMAVGAAAAVPEPAAMVVAAIGCLLAAGFGRR